MLLIGEIIHRSNYILFLQPKKKKFYYNNYIPSLFSHKQWQKSLKFDPSLTLGFLIYLL